MNAHSFIHDAIQQGMHFLLRHQSAKGSFHSITAESINCINDDMLSFDEGHQKGWVNVDKHSIFPTLLITACFQNFPQAYHTQYYSLMLHKMLAYIQGQRRKTGLWNHFEDHTTIFKVCPHDIDSTSFASAILRQANQASTTADATIKQHINQHGLFYTFFALRFKKNTSFTYWWVSLREIVHPIKSYFFWRNGELARTDIDAVVNANVLFYMGPCAESKAPLRWIIECLKNGEENTMDKWYKNPVVIYYFITRIIKQGFPEIREVQPQIILAIMALQQHDGSIQHKALETALAINILLDFQEPIERIQPLVHYLLQTQTPDGNWPRRVVYTGGHKRIMGWGSDSLTTAFALEALTRFTDRFPE
jgi:hypothetical protein